MMAFSVGQPNVRSLCCFKGPRTRKVRAGVSSREGSAAPPATDAAADASKCPVLRALKQVPEYKDRGLLDTLDFAFGDVLDFQAKQLRGQPLVKGWIGQPSVVVGDVDLMREVFTNDEVFAPEKKAAETLGPQGLLFQNGAKHSRMRSFVQPAFTPEALEVYTPKVQELTEKYLSRMAQQCAERGGRPLSGYDNMRQLTFEIICQVVAGIDLPERELQQLFNDNKDVMAGVITVAFPTWTWLDWAFMPGGRARAARQRIVALAQAKIEEARARLRAGEGVEGRGQLMELVARSSSHPEPMTDEELVDNMQVFIIAGFDTTSALITYLMQNIHLHPEHFQAVRQEQQHLMAQHGTQMDARVLRMMTRAEQFVMETLRLRFPAPHMSRIVEQDADLGGYGVAKGQPLLVAFQYMSANDPTWQGQTGDMDPSVFNPRRYEGVKGAGQTTFPFGFGKHSCIGQPLALLEAKVALAVLARGYHVRVAEQPRWWNTLPVVHPGNGMPVVITRA